MLTARVVEWFLLREPAARARARTADERAEASRRRALAKQKRDAAEVLWEAGSAAEALRLAGEARAIATSTSDPPAATPTLDAEVTERDGERFGDWLAACDEALDRGAREDPTLDEVGRLRVGRFVGAAFAIAVLVLVALALRTPPTLRATASASWDSRYDAAKAVDGSERTDWLLPDKVPGWIEVQLIPPRKIARVRLLNARNVGYDDRATREFHLEARLRGALVKSFDGSFSGHRAEPDWRSFELDAKIDAIRVDVRSWDRNGGGFGEITVE